MSIELFSSLDIELPCAIKEKIIKEIPKYCNVFFKELTEQEVFYSLSKDMNFDICFAIEEKEIYVGFNSGSEQRRSKFISDIQALLRKYQIDCDFEEE